VFLSLFMVIDRRHPTIIIDSREKKPLKFPGLRSTRKALQVGDYSIFGYGQLVVVEYKSLPDWINWLSYSDRRRFEGQVHKLLTIPYRCVVVGGALGSPGPKRILDPDTIVERAALVTAMGIPVVFCKGRIQAARFTLNFLQQGIKLC
jgi:ERCC4-type nuclease